MKIHQKYYFGTLAHQIDSHHNKDIYKTLKFQRWQAGDPFQNTNSISMMKLILHLYWRTTNRNLGWMTKTISQTMTPLTKTTKCLTTPKTSVKLPTTITASPKTIMDTSKRGSHVPVIPPV